MNPTPDETSKLVDALLAEFGIVEVAADAELPKAAPPKAESVQ